MNSVCANQKLMKIIRYQSSVTQSFSFFLFRQYKTDPLVRKMHLIQKNRVGESNFYVNFCKSFFPVRCYGESMKTNHDAHQEAKIHTNSQRNGANCQTAAYELILKTSVFNMISLLILEFNLNSMKN